MYKEVTAEYAAGCVRCGCTVLPSFVPCPGEDENRKGRLVVNLHKQSHHWEKKCTKIKMMTAFALHVKRDDVLFWFDIESGYHHCNLHPNMRDLFLFHYGCRFYN